MTIQSETGTMVQVTPPIFIVGCPRSGTTLVGRILDSHSRIAIYNETHYYSIFGPDRHRYGDFRRSSNLMRLIDDFRETIRVQGLVEAPTSGEILGSLVEPTFEGVLAALLHVHAQRQGKARGGDKTPDHHRNLPEILEMFPQSPVIFVLRDPRDTVRSIKKTFDANTEAGTRMWRTAFMSYWRARNSVYTVRYEELVQNPSEVTKGMCDFLGENYEPEMLNFFEQTPETIRALPKVGKLLGPVDSISVGGFQQMPLPEIAQIEGACAFGMEAMGYPFTATVPRTSEGDELTALKGRSRINYVLERLRWYWAGSSLRRRTGFTRWKLMLRVRVRYLLALGPLRSGGN